MPRLDELSHPLLGDAPTLQLMPDRTDIAGELLDHSFPLCLHVDSVELEVQQ